MNYDSHYAPLEAERHIAGCLLIRPHETVAEIRRLVTVADFVNPVCRDVYKAALELIDENVMLDPVIIQQRIESWGHVFETELMRELMATYTTTASVACHAEIVRREAEKRKAAGIAMRLAMGEESLEKTIDALTSLQASSGSEALEPSEMVQRFADYVAAIDSGEKYPFQPTGYAKLDRILGGGLVDGGLITLAARPGTGKTTVGLNIAELIASRGGRVLYISLEMPYVQLMARRTGILRGLNYGKLLSGGMDETMWRQFTEAQEQMAREKLFIVDKPCGVADVERHIRTNNGLNAVVIDHIGLITNPRGGSRYEFMTETTHRLKQIALSTGVPIVALCQLNRQPETRSDKRPTMADLRDSGAIEEDSDVVGLIFREGLYLPENERPKPWEAQTLKITVEKNRHGIQGTALFTFCGTSARLREL